MPSTSLPPFMASTSLLDWHPSGWTPVFVVETDRDPTPADLAGFSRFGTECGKVRRFMFSRKMTREDAEKGGHDYVQGGFYMREGSEAVAYGPSDNQYLAWVVVDDDPNEIPGFWPV